MADEQGNPNNCETCDHKKNPDGGHCYMFRNAPTEVCMQHTGRQSTGLRSPLRGRTGTSLAFAIATSLLNASLGPYEPVIMDLDGSVFNDNKE